MSLKQYINFSQFCDWFNNSGSYKNNFTYEGKRALFDYLEQLSEDIGEDIEFDPIAICCEYTQYDDIADFNQQHGREVETIEEIEELTTVIRIKNSEAFIIVDF